MSRERKFIRGERIMSLTQAVRIIELGQYMMVGTKPQHAGWTGSWSVNYLMMMVRRGWLYTAQINPAWRARVTRRAA